MGRQRLTITSVAFLFLVNGIVLGAWATNIPVLKSNFSLTEAELGVLLLIMSIGAVMTMLLSGQACMAFGSRVVAGVSALGFAVFAVVVFQSSQFHWLVISIFLFGAANGAMDISMNQQAVLLERTLQTRLMSRLHGWFSLGALLGAMSTYLADGQALSPVDQNLLLLGAIFATSLFLYPRLLHEVKHGPNGKNSKRFGSLGHGGLRWLGLLSFLTMLSEGAIADWGSVFLVEHSDIPPFKAALGYAVFAMLMMIARFSGDKSAAWLGNRRLIALSGFLTALGMSLVLSSDIFLLQIVGFGVLGLGLANMVPVIFSSAARLDGVPPASAITLVSTCGYAGFLIGPAFIGAGAEQIGLSTMLFVIPVIGVVFVLARTLFS